MIEAIAGIVIFAVWGSLLFPEESRKIKGTVVQAAKLTGEQMSASARTKDGSLVKAYRSQEEARRHRVQLKVGTVIYLPDGETVTVAEGMNDIECDGWWYAWMSI